MNDLKICVYGAGAVGGLIAAWLAQAGHDVSVVARGAHLAAMRQNGLKVDSKTRPASVKVRAAADAAELGSQDYVIVAVKEPAMRDVAAGIAPLLKADTAVVTAMNGVPWWYFHRFGGNHQGRTLETLDRDGRVGAAIAGDRVIGCVVHLAAAVSAPGTISHTFGQRLILGEPGGMTTLRTGRMAEALRGAGFDCVVSPAIERDVWVKLWGNATFNPISALTGATGDLIANDPLIRDLCLRMMVEIAEIGKRIGIEIGMSAEARIDMARELGAFKTSMLQDMEGNKPLEIDGLLSVVTEIADMVGVQAPFTTAVLGLIRQRASLAGLYPRATAASAPSAPGAAAQAR
jgi:2-dehydropantoate 2-reductase